jgi:hypothetical protein
MTASSLGYDVKSLLGVEIGEEPVKHPTVS